MAGEPGIVVERAVAHPLLPEALDVHVGDRQLRGPFESPRLGQQFARFVDRPLSVPGEVGRALARPGGGEDVSGEAAVRLAGAKQFALVRLADRDVGGGEVGQDQRPSQRAERRRRLRRPEILANLDMEDEVGKVVGGEDQIGAERHIVPGDRRLHPRQARAGSEPALLIIFAVIGQEDLRHDAQDRAARDHHAAIVEPPVATQRRADDQHGLQPHALFRQPRQPLLDRVEECLLQEQIVDRIGGDIELRKHRKIDAARVRLAGKLERLIDVERDIAGRGHGARRRDPDEAVAVDRGEGRALVPGHHSISVIMSTAASIAAIRVAPRPIPPKCSSR